MTKKLIEVALPLEAINRESAREKSIRHGHPSTLHLWWARRPLAACRAVLFASLVDDPSSHPNRFPTPEAQERERRRLFRLLEELVRWENSNNPVVLEAARAEVRKATGDHPPPVLDPFCGGGSIPLEAQRLGLEAHASDLNPVAVLITKALIEIPPRFAGQAPVHPGQGTDLVQRAWTGAAGLAEDVRYYGQWMRDEAEKRIGMLYPKVSAKAREGREGKTSGARGSSGASGDGSEMTVIAWLWARTVKCPNPACGARMPLVRSFALSTKAGKKAWVEPVVDKAARTVRFEVRTGEGVPQAPPKIGRGAKFKCMVCDQSADDQHIKDEGTAGRMGAQLMAIVTEGPNGRVYLAPNEEHEAIARSATPSWKPEYELAGDRRAIWCPLYGLDTFDKLFTPRQLVALTTFSDLVLEARERVLADAVRRGWSPPERSAKGAKGHEGDSDAAAGPRAPSAADYADAVSTYLAFAVDRLADRCSSICSWDTGYVKVRNTFARQAIPMTWDFAEGNVFSESTGNFGSAVDWIVKVVASSSCAAWGCVQQLDASATIGRATGVCISTDPPYYDNIGYADLSDFFYVWLRRSLGKVYPDLFSTLLVPKAPELVATPYRFGGDKAKAQQFFEDGLGRAFGLMRQAQHPDYPLTVYYAFKQAEEDESAEDAEAGSSRRRPGGRQNQENGSGRASTGWETMLEGLLRAGFAITGTWPMRTELTNRPVGTGTNALASSIVLVCRPRAADAALATRRELLAGLRRELPEALRLLQHGNIAPVDLAQAAIGPGMAVFSRYAKVVEADGQPMRVRTALALINEVLDEVFAEQEGEFDADTRWALAWFDQYGMEEGPYGTAETLSRAKNTSVQGMVDAGILYARAGKVRLLRREELDPGWDPARDRRLTVWEVAQHLIHTLETRGESGAAELARRVGAFGETARDLAYRLYTICERRRWAQEALAYNSLVIAWSEVSRLAASTPAPALGQQDLL